MRVVLERGPKEKKFVAYCVDWPGWSRGATSPEKALATLETYRERYRPVAKHSGLGEVFDRAGKLKVVEDRIGTGSTDFWGISFSPSTLEGDPMDEDDFVRGVALLRGSWALFDEVAATVSPEMRKGSRGGGRDRDDIIRHTNRVESEDFAKRLGLRIDEGAALAPDGLKPYREAYIDTMVEYRGGHLKPMRTWTLPFLIRHSAFHVLDHAWEMQDKNLN